jgi:hypothetical protein
MHPVRGDDRTDPYNVLGQTDESLEHARRELRISLAFALPGAPSRVPALTHLRAITAELARRGYTLD